MVEFLFNGHGAPTKPLGSDPSFSLALRTCVCVQGEEEEIEQDFPCFLFEFGSRNNWVNSRFRPPFFVMLI